MARRTGRKSLERSTATKAHDATHIRVVLSYSLRMAIDDNPIEVLRKQFELEDSSKSPVSTALVKAASELLGFGKLLGPLDPIIRKVAEIISDDGYARIKIMLETIEDQVVKHDKEIRELREKQTSEQSKQRSEQEARLVVDGARRAAATRSIERVKRIGIILAQAISGPTPPDEDEIEEMMRIATELADETSGISGSW